MEKTRHLCVHIVHDSGKTFMTYLTSSRVYPVPHPSSTSSIPWSNIAALSSLALPSTRLQEKSSQQPEGSYDDVEDRKDAPTSSLTTSILSVLHFQHPTTLPSDHLHSISTTLTDTGETVPDVSELWVTGRNICHCHFH